MSDMAPIEHQVLSSLFYDEMYSKRALPYLKDEYFESDGGKIIVKLVRDFVNKYSKQPTVEAIAIDLQSLPEMSQHEFNEAKDVLQNLEKVEVDRDWLIDQSEKWCQDRALYLGIMQSIQILDQKEITNNSISRGAIPSILQDALSTNFDRSIGHDYTNEVDKRYDYYHSEEERIPFDIDWFNKITNGGLPKKSLTVILASTGVGKTLGMCHMAAANFLQGKHVLYLTMEMSEERISQRIDANLLNTDIHDLKTLSREDFKARIDTLYKRSAGRIVVKEFATGSANVTHFKHIISELALKKHFAPDIIYVDYMNICSSARFMGKDSNSYTIVKAIAEELRGMAVEYNVPVVTATQTNRKGSDSSNPGLTDTSDSFGTPMTADLMFALYSTEDLALQHKMLVIQLKNRDNPIEEYSRFFVGINKSRMQWFNLDEDGTAQDLSTGDIRLNTEASRVKVDTSQYDWATSDGTNNVITEDHLWDSKK